MKPWKAMERHKLQGCFLQAASGEGKPVESSITKEVLVLATVVFDSIGKRVFRLLVEITNLKFIS